MVAHVDDFLVTGPKPELIEFRRKLQLNYEVDGDILGLAEDEKAEGKFLGRKIRVKEAGIEVEGDSKLIQGLLEEYASGSREAETPGLPMAHKLEKELGDEPPLMDSAQAARFRRGAAKFNYIAQDRGDMAFASKEISKRMAKPRIGDERAIIRAVEYLRRYPRWIAAYLWQKAPGGLTIFTDSDWGGCIRTRRSTSGGVAMHGAHCLLSWARTQQVVALSSAEAELNAAVKAAQEGLSLKHLAEQLVDSVWLKLKGDSSANDGILKRTGAGKVKHL